MKIEDKRKAATNTARYSDLETGDWFEFYHDGEWVGPCVFCSHGNSIHNKHINYSADPPASRHLSSSNHVRLLNVTLTIEN